MLMKRKENYTNEEYYSEFDDEEDTNRRDRSINKKNDGRHDKELLFKQPPSKSNFGGKPANKQILLDEYEKQERKSFQAHFQALDAFTKHKMLIYHYSNHFGYRNKNVPPPMKIHKTDLDVIMENHKFIWDIEDEEELESDWGKRLAKSYYDKLFKEYCITNLERYKENKIALRWRTENEVINGKGQFICAEKHCKQHKDLESWEVNFCYIEDGNEKNALVKIRLCPICSLKLNYNYQKKKAQKPMRRKRKLTDEITQQDLTNKSQSIKENKSDINTKIEQTIQSNDLEIWNNPINNHIEKSKTEEFDDFLDDLFS